MSIIILASASCLQHDSCLTEARRHPKGCHCGRICIVLDELEFRLCVKITVGRQTISHPFLKTPEAVKDAVVVGFASYSISLSSDLL